METPVALRYPHSACNVEQPASSLSDPSDGGFGGLKRGDTTRKPTRTSGDHLRPQTHPPYPATPPPHQNQAPPPKFARKPTPPPLLKGKCAIYLESPFDLLNMGS